MSSVNSSDGSNRKQDEINRRQREEYSKKEGELIKKQQKEIRRLNEAHYQELEKLKDSQSKQMGNLSKATNDAISERDYKYQQDVEEMRELYRKQLENSANEAQRKEDIYRQATTGDARTQKEINQRRQDKLMKDSQEAMAEKDRNYTEGSNRGREMQQEAISSMKDKLNRAHAKEMDSLRRSHDAEKAELQSKYENYRDNAEGRLKGQELRHMQAQKNSSENLLNAVRRERVLRNDSEAELRQGFEDGMQTQRERFDKASRKEREAYQMSQDSLKSSVGSRIDNKIKRLEQENTELKESKIRDGAKMKSQMNRDVNKVRQGLNKNIEGLERNRQELLNASNEKTAEDIAEIRKEHSDILVDTNRFYRENQEEQNRIHQQAHDQMEGDFQGRLDQNTSQTSTRIRNILQDSEAAKAKTIQISQETNDALKRQTRDEKMTMRGELDNEKNQAVERIRDRMRKMEIQQGEKMNQVTQKYEKQLGAMKEQMVREKRLNDEQMQRTIEQLNIDHQRQLDQQSSQNSDKLRTLQGQQAEQLRTLNKKQEARIEEVIRTVKKSQS